ncbi:Galactose oxidase [Mycena chlorophos]|uniref:Galactose oxidase n=1 Tax=Mycena chlorophos TaxID=658473 RepID=A0A8H6TUG3_MYCCL|nr:Galactose oxidase [Mycena chlorophos]
MAKKKSAGKAEKTAAKKAKAVQKTEKKQTKKAGKRKADSDSDDDQDLEAILEKLRVEWEEAHKVTEEIADGPPSRRANCTFVPCPTGSNHLWCIGGEFFSDDGKAYFYNDVFRYSADKDEWRKFISPTCPGPRSAHAVATHPAGGGKIFLFGGEFSSVNQNSFHHYRDFWVFDAVSHGWDRIETKVRPSARSGHRMASWKNFIILFGGFYDPGTITKYLNDLWIFDLNEYKWKQAEFKETELRPSPRSGFSFIPTPEGILLHGGYCKEYAKGKRPIGVMLEDTWFLNLSLPTADKPSNNPIILKWERRKRPSTAYAPALRSGCTMTLWMAKQMGVMFGGVTDEDRDEETLESVFWNDLNGYQIAGKGKFVSLTLKRPKGKSKKKVVAKDDDEDGEVEAPEVDPDDPIWTTPLPRYNAMLSVLRNTLYIYGGIYERGKREYTMDDFYSIQLDKLERYTCLKKSEIIIAEQDEESSEDEDGSDEDDSDDDDSDTLADVELEPEPQEETEKPPVSAVEEVAEEQATDLRAQATAFMGVAKDRSPEDSLSTPLPGETLAAFYSRTRTHWAQKAHSATENQGKQLRRDGFTLAQETYKSYEPILREVEKILAEAGLDKEEMRVAGQGGPRAEQSRNRR